MATVRHPLPLHHAPCVTCNTGMARTVLRFWGHTDGPLPHSGCSHTVWTLQTPRSHLFIWCFVYQINVSSPNPKSLVAFSLSSLMVWLICFLLAVICRDRPKPTVPSLNHLLLSQWSHALLWPITVSHFPTQGLFYTRWTVDVKTSARILHSTCGRRAEHFSLVCFSHPPTLLKVVI